MKYILLCAISLLLPLFLGAQTDIPTTKPLIINNTNNLDLKKNPNEGLSLKLPSVLDNTSKVKLRDSLTARNIKMLPDKELKQAGYDLKIDPRIRENSRGTSGEHFGDMYLGDIKTSSKFVGIVTRDHEYVDGDRVKIYANDQVLSPNVLLTGSFKGINVNLDQGFNTLIFEALNQGSSGPNTAQVDVYDDKGQLIYSNKWLLSTGSRASLIVVKE